MALILYFGNKFFVKNTTSKFHQQKVISFLIGNVDLTTWEIWVLSNEELLQA